MEFHGLPTTRVTELVTSILMLSLLSCQSAPNKSVNTNAQTPEKTSDQATHANGPSVDLNCVINHLQNPPESFHYMFKDESSNNPWSEEADVTPQMIDGSFKSSYMPNPSPLHATPQEMPHQYQWAIGRMASLFALVRGTAVDQGAETVNGYSTTKVSIDTARGDAEEQGLFKSVLGPGGFDRGIVWVTSEGCPVKLLIDEELHAKDGSVSGKAHYEEAMIKK
jgi:hypothetical protein